jgi:hypothetical protein
MLEWECHCVCGTFGYIWSVLIIPRLTPQSEIPISPQSTRGSVPSSELATPAPSPISECCPPCLVPGGTHSFAGEGTGGANSDEGTNTLGSV